MNPGHDVLISCMALQSVPDWIAWPDGAPSLLEFAGQSPPGGGHPGWGATAARYRDASGQLLPNLFRAYARYLGFDVATAGRVGVVGFSAGSNSGVRELLRNPRDRARISFVLAVDGLHPNLSAAGAGRISRTRTAAYADWSSEVGGLEDAATQAALDAGPLVIVTASDVAASSSTNAKTASALSDLEWVVMNNVQLSGHRVVQPTVPGPFPPRTTSPVLRAGEAYPQPRFVSGCRRFVALYYDGAQARDHVLQARIVTPDVLEAFCLPWWFPPSVAQPVAVRGADPGVFVEAVSDPKLSRGAWLPPVVSAAALVAAALV